MRNKDIDNVANNVLGSIHQRIEFIDAHLEDPDERVDAQELCNLESLAEALRADAEHLMNLIRAIREAR